MAREATAAQKRLKTQAKTRRSVRDLAPDEIVAIHCQKLGISVPKDGEVLRDDAGNRIVFWDHNPDRASTMRTKQLMKQQGYHVDDIPGQDQCKGVISEERYQANLRKPVDGHIRAAGSIGTEAPVGQGLKHIQSALEDSSMGSLSEALGDGPG